MAVRTHTFNGKRFKMDFEAIDGRCDQPKKEKRLFPRIVLPNGLDDKRAKTVLITLIHEALHAEDWQMTEPKVERISSEIGSFLWRLGYRRVADE